MNKKIFGLGKKLIKHELISGSIFVFIGVIVSSFLSFILNLFLVRSFTAADYGIYASLLSLFTLAVIPAQSLITIIIRFATEFFAKNKLNEAKDLYAKLLRLMFVFSLLIFIGFTASSIFLKEFLHLDNVWYIIQVGLIVSLAYLSVVNSAFLQSLLKFPFISFSSILGSILRITIGIALVILGLRVFGALWAVFFAFLVSFLISFLPLRFLIARKRSRNIDFPLRDMIKYALPASIAILSLNSLISTDIILVKHFFSAQDAGLYGGLSLVGKVIFYFTGPISSVMFPLLIKRHSTGQNFNSLFYLALFLVTIPSIFIVAFYYVFPLISINFFLGGREYAKVSPYLGTYGLFIMVFNILNVFVNFFLSIKKTKIAFVVGAGALAQMILISLFHKTFFQVINVSLSASLVVLIVLFILYIKEYGSFKKIKSIIPFISCS
ncbi:MAG: oligosaccharide flippase family protein [Patescibacteria group bacterium]